VVLGVAVNRWRWGRNWGHLIPIRSIVPLLMLTCFPSEVTVWSYRLFIPVAISLSVIFPCDIARIRYQRRSLCVLSIPGHIYPQSWTPFVAGLWDGTPLSP
jgi:hypothetical protein